MPLFPFLLSGLICLEPFESESLIQKTKEWSDSIVADRYSNYVTPIIACLVIGENRLYRRLLTTKNASVVELTSELLNFSIEDLNLEPVQKSELLREHILIVKKYDTPAE